MASSLVNNIKNELVKVPPELKSFLLKAILLFVTWSLLYNLYLQPRHVIDPFLTSTMANCTVWFLKIIYSHSIVLVDNKLGTPFITINNIGVLSILDGCNGLELYILYTGFIICMPSTRKNMLLFIGIGIACIFISNLTRLVLLSMLQHVHYIYIDTVHHYIFTIIVYSMMFFLWVWYLKNSYQVKSPKA